MGKGRVFLIGAGFSKDRAGAPVMAELWNEMEKINSKVKNQKQKGNRAKWFEDLKRAVKELEELSFDRYKNFRGIEIGSQLRENLEYLLTIIELHSDYGTRIKFLDKGKEFDSVPFIPFPFLCPLSSKELKKTILTYLFLIFEPYGPNKKTLEFSRYINEDDEIINFNYDLILERSLWKIKKWSPLEGYVGINEFKNQEDYDALKKAQRFSSLRIHKMHGSLDWDEGNFLGKSGIKISLENPERKSFFFENMEQILNRESNYAKFPSEEKYVGSYDPPWVLPSFVKPFEREEMMTIWGSAIGVFRSCKELIIIGYSFRPEDTNANLLLTVLPKNVEVVIVDKNECLAKRMGKWFNKKPIYYSCVNDYIKKRLQK